MASIFQLGRPRKSKPRRVFGQGIPTSDHRQPYSAADLEWWAQQNATAKPDYDRLAAESAWMDARESWPAERRGAGVRMSGNEEAARRYNLSPEAEAERDRDFEEYCRWADAMCTWVDHDQPGPQPY